MEKISEEKPSLAAFLNKCNVSFKDETTLELEVCGNDFAFNNVQKHTPYMEEICSQVAGQTIKLSVIANCDEIADKKKEKQMADEIKKQALSHPLVMETIELFNGKVVDVKVS